MASPVSIASSDSSRVVQPDANSNLPVVLRDSNGNAVLDTDASGNLKVVVAGPKPGLSAPGQFEELILVELKKIYALLSYVYDADLDTIDEAPVS